MSFLVRCSIVEGQHAACTTGSTCRVSSHTLGLRWPRRGLKLPHFPEAERCVRSAWEDRTIGFFVALFARREKDAQMLFPSATDGVNLYNLYSECGLCMYLSEL